jgi:nicotinate-nucleotide adenylyltransferase
MDHPDLEVTTFEAAHGFRYTYETVGFLTKARPKLHFVWIMGADSLENFDRWERWEDIARTMPIAVYARPGTSYTATSSRAALAMSANRVPEDAAEALADRRPPAWIYLHGVMSGESSTAIRKARKSTQ